MTEDREARNAEIEQLYREGYSMGMLAERYGISREAIRKILSRRGVPVRSRGISPMARKRRQEHGA